MKYDELMLGEKAKDAFLKGESTEGMPVYLNTRPVFNGLNVTDLAIAAVLGGLNSLYVGDTGTGKSQLAQDFYNNYFGGNQSTKGHGVKIRGRPELDIYDEVYTQINKTLLRRELTENVQALMHWIDEINRCHPITQNQFFGLGDGHLEHGGMKAQLGKDGYSVCIATANLGNGEFQGTFDTDKALYNRFGIVLDFDYEMFRPTNEDKMLVTAMRAANPRVKDAPVRDITDTLVETNKEISEISSKLGDEARAVIYYLTFGLDNCQAQKGIKEKIWPVNCQDCDLNKGGDTLCSLIRAPETRTIQATIRYGAALYYLSKLKFPKKEPDYVDIMFKAFELTGAYQKLLNPGILRQKYYGQNPKMMKDAVDALKKDFRSNEEFLFAALALCREGEEVDRFFKKGETIGNWDNLNDNAKRGNPKIEPFVNERPVGMEWVKDARNLITKMNEK
jgi:MoxR-like ATPase